MPRKALTPRRQRQGQLTVAVVRRLLTGHWFPMGSEGHPEPSEAELRDLWTGNRDRLMRKWFAVYEGEGGAFTRPWAWWKYGDTDHPGPHHRKLLSGEVLGDGCWFGTPTHIRRQTRDARWETERQYLARRRLYTPEEKKASQRRTQAHA